MSILYHLTSSSPGNSSTPSSASPTTSSSLAVSTDGSCGDGTGFVCLSSRWGDCCSTKGWCGKEPAYCGKGCQDAFGNCTATPGSSSGSSELSISTDGSCGGSTGFICLGSEFGNCCSAKGWCGGNSTYCSGGCQSDFGHCGDGDSSNRTAEISTDGTCGGSSGNTCLGSEFGDCCSPKGWCGSKSSYCDAGCQSEFGTCSPTSSATGASVSVSATASSVPRPTVETTAFKAGIATGSAIAFLLIVLAALFFLRRRRRNRMNANSPLATIGEKPFEAPSDGEVSNINYSTSDVKVYPSVYPSELSASAGYYPELPTNGKLDVRIQEREVGF